MFAFRTFLVTFLIVLVGYTSVVIGNHGAGLVPIFFGDMAKMAWPGQFNLDFFGFLCLSGLWTAWRNEFSPVGVILGLVAVTGGMLFLTIYLLVLSFQARGDMAEVLLGRKRAAA
ncbi:MAG: hypothetical protein GC152_06195 [Alphaproteobacteria bacterium]|nr:hypothetical protein [Alphaproteobacteria bacterium]